MTGSNLPTETHKQAEEYAKQAFLQVLRSNDRFGIIPPSPHMAASMPACVKVNPRLPIRTEASLKGYDFDRDIDMETLHRYRQTFACLQPPSMGGLQRHGFPEKNVVIEFRRLAVSKSQG